MADQRGSNTNTMANDLDFKSSNDAKPSKDSISTTSGDQVKKEEISSEKESFLSKARRLITVEPLLFIYMISFQASLPIQQQFAYRKLLEVYANESSSVYDISLMSYGSDGNIMQCANSPSRGENQVKAQTSSALLSIVLGLSSVIPALFSTVLLGSFSDRAGRKWAMIPPFIGDILKNTIVICIILFDLPFWQLLIVGGLINGIFGNSMLVINAALAYIADISTIQQRMFRIFVIELLLGFADLAANLIIGHLIAAIGFLYSYVFMLCLNFISLTYAIFILKETVQRKPGIKLCSIVNYSKAIKVYARGDVPGRRTILLTALLVFLFQTMVELGANGGALDLYFMNVPLCWQSVALGYYRAFIVIVRFFFNVLAIRLLMPKLTAGGLLLLGCVSMIIYDLFLAQVTADWMAYVAVVAGLAVGIVSTMIRGITSQHVEPHEQGALFAGQGIAILVSGLSGTIMYNVVYSRTVKTFSRTIFYVGAAQGVFTLGFASILFWSIRKYETTRKPIDRDVNSTEKDCVEEKQDSNKPAEYTRF